MEFKVLAFLILKKHIFMKKAKMMLTAITIFAVVGGAFAFKAKSASSLTIFTGTTVGTGSSCTNELHGATIGASSNPKVRASTVSLSTNCPITSTVAAQD